MTNFNIEQNKCEFYEMLVPSLNFIELDDNLKLKMMPLENYFDKFDLNKTCCKINTNYLNLKVINFDRHIIYSLDKWFFELHKLLETKDIKTTCPTAYFDDQNLIDLICILLFIIDNYIQSKRNLNICFRQKLIEKYSKFLSISQTKILYLILVKTNQSSEILPSNDLDLSFDNLLLSEARNPFSSSFFFPIQSTCFEKWLPIGRTKLFDLRFLKTSNNFYLEGNKNLNCFNYNYEPVFIFGLCDNKKCEIFFCKYNKVQVFLADTDSLVTWFNNGISLNEESRANFNCNFPVYSLIGIQDLILMFQSWIYLKNSFKTCLRTYNSLTELTFKLCHGKLETWPFNNQIFTFYYFSYVYVFHFITKTRDEYKRFDFSWNNILKDKCIFLFELNESFIDNLNFPKRFKLKTNPPNMIDFKKFNCF